ncbi:carboxypeptidase regulatory-like domain-containing protein [Methanooceanicella nereidis]|uniref:carboxypeptidase regulatory-like domain-containing protein n=1 Tax=Methanooceanicella nereidis TaxID=2052831 RepID=UPI001E4079FF|nr:carboxypeptidase regulatory-like domain-containing protein [Methanocella sp. CWC-04]
MNLAFINYILVSSEPANAASTGYIIGRVTLPDGIKGVENCDIKLLDKYDNVASILNTDQQGNFYITNVEPSETAGLYRLIADKPGWGQSTTQQFNVYSNTSSIVAIRMYPIIGQFTLTAGSASIKADGSSTINITITARDTNGDPLPDGFNVRLIQESYYAAPGLFPGEGNKYDITLPLKDGMTVEYGRIPADTLSRNVSIKATILESGKNSRSVGLKIDHVNPNIITGTVYDAGMKPVPYASVYLYRWDGSRYVGYNSSEDPGYANDGRSVADSSGVYRYTILPAGDYRVAANYCSFNNSTDVRVVSGSYVHDIVLSSLKYGMVKGMVLDSDSSPVAGADVTISLVKGDKLEPVMSVRSGYDGSFTFDSVRYGNYGIEAVKNGLTANAPLWLDVDKASVTMMFHIPVPAAPINTPEPTSSPVNTATPAEATVAEPDVDSSPLYSFGVAVVFLSLFCGLASVLLVTISPKK